MSINLRIERLVLDGFTLTSHERRELQTDVERHLTRLLGADGRRTWQARRQRAVLGDSLTATEGPGLGKGIAESVHQAVRHHSEPRIEASPVARPEGDRP